MFLLQDLLNKSSLETHKLDLMAEISNLKLKLASADRERQEMRQSLLQAEVRTRTVFPFLW